MDPSIWSFQLANLELGYWPSTQQPSDARRMMCTNQVGERGKQLLLCVIGLQNRVLELDIQKPGRDKLMHQESSAQQDMEPLQLRSKTDAPSSPCLDTGQST